jgi:hypothetical protein
MGEDRAVLLAVKQAATEIGSNKVTFELGRLACMHVMVYAFLNQGQGLPLELFSGA